ncbi:3-hydroxy-3-methylglutaryl-Coenzyme A reductase [Oopsacas minuta]|uniref:3-hydroxy-3-methylglutaryl coenzyme A reductase n=1 Tax=Oopsacas minuta TaxID=111878 RepID=A0AAV7JX08_9METZ|nr:3-hydroxy-3-methylglutaryl-Coenzyme A reductase [Oopsacas minuta]
MLLYGVILAKLFYSNSNDTDPVKKTLTDYTELNIKNHPSKYHNFIPQSLCYWLERILGAYGYFCATHAWEAICTIVTLTMCVVSCGLVRSIPQGVEDTESDSEVEERLLSLVTNCLAVGYLYTQFHQLQKLGFKFTFTIIGIFMLFASLMLTFQCLIILGCPIPTCDQALPFFFFITDLGKVKQVGIYAYGARNRKDACSRVRQGISSVGTGVTIESIFLTSILIITSYITPGIAELCLFGILWIISSYFLFVTFLPAALALLFESGPTGEPFKPLDSLTRAMAGKNRIRRNFVVHRVRLIMFAGLAVIYLNSRIPFASVLSKDIPWPDAFYVITHIVYELARLSPQKYVALGFFISLVFKYTLIDQQEAREDPHTIIPSALLQDTTVVKGVNNRAVDTVTSSTPVSVCEASTQTESEQVVTPVKTGIFYLSSSSSSTEDIHQEAEIIKTELPTEPRPFSACVELFNSDKAGPSFLSDQEIEFLVEEKYIQAYKLEDALGDPLRGVRIRRAMIERKLPEGGVLEELPYQDYNYKMVMGACCENVIGYIPVPIGVSGPLLMDGISYYIPMSTTEGCLVASTNRGCRALTSAGGVKSCVTNDGMSRGPVVRFPSAVRAAEIKNWFEQEANFVTVKEWFDSTSRYARLKSLKVALAGRLLYIRFKAVTGDAMGMNMLGKGTEKSLAQLNKEFPDMEILSLSGNFCVDKKPSALNWLEGRGKSVVAESTIPGKVITQVLKTSAKALVELNLSKNLVGSAMAGSLGGYNAHSANVVAAIFIACGQDPAQVVGSANCMTLMESYGPTGDDLYISCTMPSLEVGTVGGGTILPAQSACLKMMGVEGPDFENSGGHASLFARLICSTVLAGELSLMSALAAGHLVKSHLRHNRSSISLNLRTVREPNH